MAPIRESTKTHAYELSIESDNWLKNSRLFKVFTQIDIQLNQAACFRGVGILFLT